MHEGLIGYMFQDKPRNIFENIWWKIKGLFGWKNRTGIPIVVSDKVVEDKTICYIHSPKEITKIRSRSR